MRPKSEKDRVVFRHAHHVHFKEWTKSRDLCCLSRASFTRDHQHTIVVDCLGYNVLHLVDGQWLLEWNQIRWQLSWRNLRKSIVQSTSDCFTHLLRQTWHHMYKKRLATFVNRSNYTTAITLATTCDPKIPQHEWPQVTWFEICRQKLAKKCCQNEQ